MYVPPHFEEARSEQLQALIRAHPLGALVVQGPDGLDANHLPFELDASGDGRARLLAHVARANLLWRDAKDGAEALVIFRGADAYISPNWYPSKHESHRQVPTWNYRVVHVHGRLRIRDDERFVRGLVARLTRTHEAQTGAPKPWRMTESTPEFIAKMLAAIVGIEIEIVRMTGKWKLGQNRETRDRVSAALALQRLGHDEIAAAMLAAGN